MTSPESPLPEPAATAESGQPGETTRWLTPEERELWLELREFVVAVPRAVDRQLARDAGLSGGEYSVLAAVSEAPPEGVRSGDLSRLLEWEKSRLSHLLRRMEAKGLVHRCAASADGRGQEVTLTPLGWDTIRAAAPGHVTMVRETVFDPLSGEEQRQLRASLLKIRAAATASGLW